ncbi:MAG: NAD(P)-dependent oxidoreductase, partial [Flavobacteriaceae bacterium]
PAKRPMRSTMCLDKIENSYNIEPRYWENSLEECMETLLEK